MQVVYLADYMHLAPVVARWHHDEWHRLMPGWSYESALAELETHTSHRAIPTTLIGLESDEPLGSVSLLVEDILPGPLPTPWLASLYVQPHARGRSVGKVLVARLLVEAKELGVARVYLITPGQQEFYRKLGWMIEVGISTGDYSGVVMSSPT